MNRSAKSMLWGVFCTSSWTWCIGMYMPFIMLRLWGWPGFWAFFLPNVLGCALFGFALTPARSRALIKQLGWTMALFSAVTVAYQCFFAGWAAQLFFVREGAMTTVVSTGVPIGMLIAGLWLALRRDAQWLMFGLLAFVAGLAAVAWGWADTHVAAEASGLEPALRSPIASATSLAWAVPTIAAGFLLCPYLDLTFHRALQSAPQPRLAFATFGVTFALTLLGVAMLYDRSAGVPHVGAALAVLWAVQLTFTVGAHLRELLLAPETARLPAWGTAALVGFAVLLATPACQFVLGPGLPSGSAPLLGTDTHALLPGEPAYLAFLGAYGLLFPVMLWLQVRGRTQVAAVVIVALGVPCYLLGAWNFATYLMPVPLAMALALGWRRAGAHKAQDATV